MNPCGFRGLKIIAESSPILLKFGFVGRTRWTLLKAFSAVSLWKKRNMGTMRLQLHPIGGCSISYKLVKTPLNTVIYLLKDGSSDGVLPDNYKVMHNAFGTNRSSQAGSN